MTEAQQHTLDFLALTHEQEWERAYSCVGDNRAKLNEFISAEDGDFVVEFKHHRHLIFKDGAFARLPQGVPS